MKELEKTKQISIAAVVFILVIIIGLLTYKRPQNIYSINSKNTLEKIASQDFFTSLEAINYSKSILIDIRSNYEYEKGHITNAVNIYTPEILNKENINFLNNATKEGQFIIMYGGSPNEAITPFMLLNQLGFNNLKIAAIDISYFQNKLITKNSTLENPVANIREFINESVKNSSAEGTATIIKNESAKKVITIRKKKKRAAEGGC